MAFDKSKALYRGLSLTPLRRTDMTQTNTTQEPTHDQTASTVAAIWAARRVFAKAKRRATPDEPQGHLSRSTINRTIREEVPRMLNSYAYKAARGDPLDAARLSNGREMGASCLEAAKKQARAWVEMGACYTWGGPAPDAETVASALDWLARYLDNDGLADDASTVRDLAARQSAREEFTA